MADQQVDAQVVLTADNTQYDQSMQASAANTDRVAKSVDSLGDKLNKLTKSAGRKFLTFAAADIAGITAATAAYGAYEKQLESLNSQAAILNKTVTGQNEAFAKSERTVNSLRSTFAMSTRESAALVQQLQKMSDGTASVDSLANTFSKLAKVSGEAPAALAESILTLQRAMGSPQRDTERFANTIAVLSAKSQTSALGITQFAQSIAPMARVIGMTSNEVVGVSSAFIKAGQDGYTGANAFNKILGDIANATSSGSPDLAKYANLIGLTVENFKSMDKTEAVTRIFETLNRQGPAAITTLNRLGLDGVRTQRAITALAQGGGLRSAIQEAQGADPQALNRGSKAAMDGLVEGLSRTRIELTQTAEVMGSKFAPMAGAFIKVIETMSKAVRSLSEGPVGDLVGGLMAAAAPLAAIAGGFLVASRAALIFAAANLLLRNSLTFGFRDGRAGQGGMGNISPQGSRIMSEGNFVQKWLYNRGMGGGRLLQGDPNATGPSMASRIAGRALQGAGFLARAVGIQYNPGVYGFGGRGPLDDPTARDRFFKAQTLGEARANAAGFAGRMNLFGRSMEDRHLDRTVGKIQGPAPPGPVLGPSTEEWKKATGQMNELTKATGGAKEGMRSFGSGMAYLGKNMMGATAGGIAMAGRGVGALGRYVGGALGPVGGAFLGYAAYSAYQDHSDREPHSYIGSLDPYLAKSGGTPAATFTGSWLAARRVSGDPSKVSRISQRDVLTAQMPNRSLSQSALKGMDQDKAVTYLGTQYALAKRDPAALDAMKLDLIDEFGVDGAQSIMDRLTHFDKGDTQTFMNSALDQPRHWMGLKAPSGEDIGKQYDLALSVNSERASMAYQTGGAQAGYRTQARGLVDFLGGFATSGAPDMGVFETINPLTGGFDTIRGHEEEWVKRIQENYGLKSFSEHDYKMIRGELQDAGSEAEATRIVLEKVFEGDTVDKQERQSFLDRFGVNPNLTGTAAVDAVMGQTSTSGKSGFLGNVFNSVGTTFRSVVATAAAGGNVPYSKLESVKTAVEQPENINKHIEATRDLLNAMKARGLNDAQINRRLGAMRAERVDPNDQYYQIYAGAQDLHTRQLSYRQAGMSRTERFASDVGQFRSVMNVPAGDAQQAQIQEAEIDKFVQKTEEQRQYFQQMLYQQREYEVMRSRAQEEYNLQVTYQQEDFDLNRSRAEEDYQIQRTRGIADYHRSQDRAQFDFNLSRKRQEEDFQHQKLMMVRQASEQMYNIYQRTEVQRTTDATYTLFNARDQLGDMRQQSQNLDKLRGMGLNNKTIDQLGLNDPKNAQQLTQMVSDMSENPKLVQQFNRMIRKRLKAAQNLVTDESSTEWTEFVRQYKLSRNRAMEDFDRQVRRSQVDFKRQIHQSNQDFQKSLDRQQEDYGTMVDRQRQAFNLSMEHAAEDLERSSRTIDGNLTDLLTKSFHRLSGHAKDQARTVRQTLRDLKNSATPDAIELMETLAAIFGVKYTAPRGTGPTTGSGQTHSSGGYDAGDPGPGRAAGGVIPGWSPGYDNTHFVGPGGQRLSLAGGEAVMVPEWTRQQGGEKAINAMNHAAKRGYFLGGVMPTQASQVTQHPSSQYPFARWAGDLNDPGQGDYGDPVKAWKPGRVASVTYNGAGHQDPSGSYGRWIVINHDDNSQSWYAHLSKAIVRAQQDVRAGQGIGNVGDWGNTSGAHLHFEVRNGNSPLGGNTGFGGGAISGMSVDDALKDFYPRSEASAAKMNGVHPLQRGMISGILNRMARRAARDMRKEFGAPGSAPALGPGDGAPPNVHGVLAMGRAMASQAGWSGSQWDALYQLWQHESSWNPYANNPISSAYGIPQALVDLHGIKPPYYARKTSGSGASSEYAGGDPATQIKWGLNYIRSAYGNPMEAWRHWQGAHSYGEGGIFANGAQNINVGERGPEAVLPLNDKGADFLAALMNRTKLGLEANSTQVAHYGTPMAHNMYNNYQIDKSTNFSGPITVQATDPNHMLMELKKRQRTAALTRPVMAGAR